MIITSFLIEGVPYFKLPRYLFLFSPLKLPFSVLLSKSKASRDPDGGYEPSYGDVGLLMVLLKLPSLSIQVVILK